MKDLICEDCGEAFKKHQDPDHCFRALKKDRKSYRGWYWATVAVVIIQFSLYNLYLLPKLYKIIDGWVEYSAAIEWELDGCYELKVQFNDLYEDYEHLSPKLEGEQYTMRLRVK